MKRRPFILSADNLSNCCPDIDLWHQVKKTVTPFQKNKNIIKSNDAQKENFSEKEVLPRPYLPKIKIFAASKLDLHGLTHDQAYQYLQHFVQSAYHQQLKKVTIITGKGNSRQPAFMVQNTEKADLLQIQVPRWLDHFSQVKNYQTAPRQEGGEGVLYVFLKRK